MKQEFISIGAFSAPYSEKLSGFIMPGSNRDNAVVVSRSEAKKALIRMNNVIFNNLESKKSITYQKALDNFHELHDNQ